MIAGGTIGLALAHIGAAASGFMMNRAGPGRASIWRRNHFARGVKYQPNGERECARRRRKIAAGQIIERNGLVRGA